MARIRTIKPEFWEDEIIATLSREARLLFIATFNMADDEGLLRWSPPYIKSQAFMYDDDISVSFTEQIMEQLTEAGLIFPYIGGRARQQLAFIVNFRKHQKINRPQPSKLPAPSLQSPEIRYMYGRRDGWTCHLCQAPINEKPQNDDRFNLSIDHLTPQSEGGSDHPSNVKASHQSCNKSRRNKALTSANGSSVSDSLNDSLPEQGTGNREGEQGSGSEEQGTRKQAPSRSARDEEFEAFWSAYPRKVEKKGARKAWDKAVKDGNSPTSLAEAAKRYAIDRSTQDPKFTKHPTTWLNQGCWDDEPEQRPQLRAVSGGYQPWTNPADQSVYHEDM